MDDIKTVAAQAHENAAHYLEIAARMHRDAAKQCSNGNFEKARSLATSAAEADTTANGHAMAALDQYRSHDEQVGTQKAELAAEEAARDAKRGAKADG